MFRAIANGLHFQRQRVGECRCKNLPGRKTDVQDCQWLQHLHSVGLLRGSFRPADQVCAVRRGA